MLWESEASGELPPEPLAFSRERIDYSYDLASGVPVYVRQNPWTMFDPNGLFAQEIDSFVTGAAGWIDEKTNHAVGNTINAIGSFFTPDAEAIIQEVDDARGEEISLLTAASLAAETNPISRKVKKGVNKGKKLNKGKKVINKVDDGPVVMPAPSARKTRKKGEAIVDGETRNYGQFKDFPGDGLEGHELLQNAKLKQIGADSSVKKNNPALALTRDKHKKVT